MRIKTGFHGSQQLSRGAAWIACSLALSLPLAIPAGADTAVKTHGYKVLHKFTGSDGANPYDTVAQDGSGNLVGTTSGGGTYGQGTVYRIAPGGSFTSIYSFKGGDSDGRAPWSLPKLAVDRSGNIYGTTTAGGENDTGLIFKLAPDGTETVLHTLDGTNDGWFPSGSVIIDKKTNDLYGTTVNGGSTNLGTVYKLAPDGTFTILPSVGPNGLIYPENGLIEDKHHNIYGTASEGGSAGGWGTVFKIGSDGRQTIMYSFFGRDDGGAPYSALVQDAAGNIYGTTDWDGAKGGGTIFKITPNGIETTLYSFAGSVQSEPYPSTLVIDGDGNFYGTTQAGGLSGHGSVFELTSSGELITLHDFAGGADGATPASGVTLVGNRLYGTTIAGGGSGCGGSGCGAVFRLKIK